MKQTNEGLIKNYFLTFYKKELSPNDNLFELGALDSMGIVSLMSYLEKECNITIEPEDINEENFSTIKAICSCLEKYQK